MSLTFKYCQEIESQRIWNQTIDWIQICRALTPLNVFATISSCRFTTRCSQLCRTRPKTLDKLLQVRILKLREAMYKFSSNLIQRKLNLMMTFDYRTNLIKHIAASAWSNLIKVVIQTKFIQASRRIRKYYNLMYVGTSSTSLVCISGSHAMLTVYNALYANKLSL